MEKVSRSKFVAD